MAASNEKTPAQQRLQHFIDSNDISVYTMAKVLGVTQMRIWRAMDKQHGVDSDLLSLISANYPTLNIDWVITGRGEMFRSETDENNVVNEAAARYGVSKPIKIISRHMAEDYVKNCHNSTFVRKLPNSGSDISDQGLYRDFEVVGSMLESPNEKGIMDGDYVRCQFVSPEMYLVVLRAGQLLTVVTKKQIHVLMLSEVSDKQLTLRPWNPMYPEISIPITQIQEIWIYRTLITNRDFEHFLYKK